MNTESKHKSKSIVPLGFVMLSLTVIFVVLSYGYGNTKALTQCNDFYHENADAFIKGYAGTVGYTSTTGAFESDGKQFVQSLNFTEVN